MKYSGAISSKKINSSKQLQRELAAAASLFQSKESEYNWEEREQTLLWLKSLLHHTCFDHWKDIIIRGVHDLVFGIADAIQSLRTKYVLVAFDLITDIGHIIGTRIDATTFETLFSSLLKCGNSSKQMIAKKALQTTTIFLSTTSYHNKAITLLCLNFNDDKNPQSRDFIAIYLKTCLQTHAPRTIVRENMERLNTLNHIERFLKTGILDATPSVRQSCRSTFWIYHKYWPLNAEKLLKSFDLTARKQLEKSKPSENNTDIKRQSILGKRPRSPTSPAANDPSSFYIESASKLPHLSVQLKKKTPSFDPSLSTPTHAPSSLPLASASLLHLLRSHDITNNCNGLRILSKRLCNIQKSPSNTSYETVLPSTVPNRADLIPILLNYLSLDRMMANKMLCDQLMTWDCLSGIFVHIFSLQHFLPTLILAGGHRHCRGGHLFTEKTTPAACWQHCHSQCKLGLKRLKLYLKYNDPDLFQSLLDLLLAATVPGTPGLRDPNAKHELRKTTPAGTTTTAITQERGTGSIGDNARDDLVRELIQWLDDIVCNYVGLREGDDDDDDDSDNGHDLMVECQQQAWAKDTRLASYVCTQWLGDNDKLASCMESILGLLKSCSSFTTHSTVFTSLIMLVGRLRLVSIRVFDMVVYQTADKDITHLLDTCLGRQHSNAKSLCQSDVPANVGNGFYDGGGTTLMQSRRYHDNMDDPPPAYDDIFDRSPLRLDADDDDSRSLHHEPSFTLTTLNQQDSEDGLSIDDDGYDVLDTSLGSINLEIMSPEPSIASTQDPSELDDFTMEHTASIHEDLGSEDLSLEYRDDNENDNAMISTQTNDAPSSDTKTTTRTVSNKESLSANLLTRTVERLCKTTTLDYTCGILGTLEHLCKEYTVKNEADYGKNGKVWMRETSFSQSLQHSGESSLLKTLIDRLTDDLISLSRNQQQQQQNPSSHDEQQHIMAILRLIKQIMVHQPFLFQRHDNDAEAETVSLAIATALIYTKCEKYGKIPIMVDDINDLLFSTINIQSCMTMTTRLLKQQYDIDVNDQKDKPRLSLARAHPMATLFNMVIKLAPKLNQELMNEFMTKKECSDCFIQGINHPALSIRQSCVNALVALSYASGTYQDIKHYLPNLRKEQQTLLNYYINQRQ